MAAPNAPLPPSGSSAPGGPPGGPAPAGGVPAAPGGPAAPAASPTPAAPGPGATTPARAADGGSDRRLRPERRQGDRRQRNEPVAVERRSGHDRRQGDRRAPRNINAYDLGADELEFINAISAFKQRSGRAFPTWSDVLRIVRELGYEKRR